MLSMLYHLQALLVGIGADEQLAGYSRHRQKFKNGGWPNLLAEIDFDIKRISSRNLGRDDRYTALIYTLSVTPLVVGCCFRCIADHSREARFPYLDEDVVSFLQQLRIDAKVPQ